MSSSPDSVLILYPDLLCLSIHKPGNTKFGSNILNNIPGIMMLISNNSVVTNNTFINCGLMLWGYNNFVYNNTVNGKPLVYLESTSDKVID